MSAALQTAPGTKGSCKFGSLLCLHLNSCLSARLEGSVRALSGSLDLTYIVYTGGTKMFFFPLKCHQASASVNNGEKQRGWLHSRDERSRDFSGPCSCALK